MALNINWAVPEGVNVEHVLQAGFSMMDGLQLRWLRAPGQDLRHVGRLRGCADAPAPVGRVSLSVAVAAAIPPNASHHTEWGCSILMEHPHYWFGCTNGGQI